MAKNKLKETVEAAAETEKVETAAETGRIKVKRVAESTYHGFDGKDPVLGALTVKSGEEVEVSIDKADQLLVHFPKDWKLV